MGTTKKIIAAAALMAVVFIIGGSYWTGKSTEKTFRANAEEMARYGVNVTLTDYQRGLFSATARTEWSSVFPEEASPPLTVTHNIRHGSLLFPVAVASVHSELMPSKELTAMLVEVFGSDPFGGKPPLTVESTIGWGGGSHVRIVSPAFEMSAGEGQARYAWKGLDGKIAVDSALSKIKADIVMGGLSVVGDNEEQLQIGRTTFRADMKKAAGHELFVGTADFAQDRLRLRTTDEDTGATSETLVENLRSESSATISNGALEVKTRFDADKIVMENGATTIEKPGVTFLYENIDARALETLLDAAQDHGGYSALLVLWTQAEVLLRRQPAVAIQDLSARWPEGMMTGNLRVAYVGDGNFMQPSPSDLAADLRFSLPRARAVRLLEMQAAFDGNERKAKRHADTLNTLIQIGILVEKDGILSIDASYQDGALSLNGQPPIPLGAVQGLLGLMGF